MAGKLFATINGKQNNIILERSRSSSAWSTSDEQAPDILQTSPSMFSVIRNGKSYNALVLKEDQDNGSLRIRIGGKTYTVNLQDERSQMFKTLGLDKAVRKVREIKAPMPGMVINILVSPGDLVKKNDPILVLEAMKMENVIKAPDDATVKSVQAEKGKAVEKGQLLVSFE